MISHNKKIIDKEWLDKVYFAYYNAYSKQTPNKDVEDFITWLYKQYGYIKPK